MVQDFSLENLSEEDTIGYLIELDDLLASATSDFAIKIEEAYEAEMNYRLEHAKALLRATGTVKEKEAKALVACESLFIERKDKEALAEAAKEVMRSLRQRCEVNRSLNASVRVQTSEGGYS